MPKHTSETAKDFDPIAQGQFARAKLVLQNTDLIVGRHDQLDWNEIEQSKHANMEWFWAGAQASAAYHANFLRVQIHPGWVQNVTNM